MTPAGLKEVEAAKADGRWPLRTLLPLTQRCLRSSSRSSRVTPSKAILRALNKANHIRLPTVATAKRSETKDQAHKLIIRYARARREISLTAQALLRGTAIRSLPRPLTASPNLLSLGVAAGSALGLFCRKTRFLRTREFSMNKIAAENQPELRGLTSCAQCEPGDRRKPLALRPVQNSAFLSPLDFGQICTRSFQRNRSNIRIRAGS